MSDNLKSSSNAVLDRSLAIIGESSAKDLMDITRAGRNLEETENQQLEIAVNTRAIELSLTANPYALRHLGKAIANLLEPEQSSFAGENIGQGYLPAQHNQQGKFLHTTGSPESSGSDSSKTWKEVDLEYVFDLQSTNPSHPETFKYDSVLEKFTNKLAFVVDVYESKFDLPHTAVHGNIAYVTSLKQIRFYNGIEWLNLAGAYNQLQNWEVLIGQTHDPVSTVSIPWQSTTKYDFDGTTATLDQLLGGVIEAAPASRWSSNDREDQQLISTSSDDNISTTTYGTQFGDFTYETTRGGGGHEGTTQATGSVDENGITIRAPHWSWGEWTIYKTLNTGDEVSVSGEYSSVHNAYGSVDLYLSKVDGTIRNIPQTSGYIQKKLRAEGSGTTTGTFNESLKSTQSGLHAITIRASNTAGGTATFNSLVISPGISNETVASVALPISENSTFEFDNTEVTGGEFISVTKDPFTGTKGWSPRTVGDNVLKPTVGSVTTNIFNDNAVFTYEGTERTDTGFLPKDNRWSLVVTPQPDASDMTSGGLMSQRFDYSHSHTNLAIALDTDLLTNSGDRSSMSHMNPQSTEVASEVTFTGGDVINRNYIAMGYFKAPSTGIFTFKLYADNRAAMWFGEQAYPHPTDTKSTTNALLDVNGSWKYKAVSLEKDMFYPVMISYYDNGGTDSLQFKWFGPGVEETDDLTGHFHYYGDGSRFHVDQRSTFVGRPDEENTLFNNDTVYTMYGTEETTGQTIGGVYPALTESRWDPTFAQKSSRFNYSEGQRPLGDDSSYVSAPLGSGVNDTFTLEFWFKPNSDMTNKIVFQTGYPGIRVMGDGYTQQREPGNSHGYSSGSGVVVGEWNHYVFTREGNTHRVWINGQRKTTNIRTPYNAGGNHIHVGGYTSGDSFNGFDGYITSVKITRGQNLYSEYENENSFVPQGQPTSDDVPFTLEIDGVASIWNEQLSQTGNSEGTIFSSETGFTWEGTVVTGGLRIGGGAGDGDTDSIWSLYPQAESENDVQRIAGNTDYGWFTDGARPFAGTLTTEGETIGGYITESNSIWNAREFYESENEIQRIAGNTDYGWFTDGARPFDGTLTTEGEVIGGYDIPDPSFWAYSTVEESENTVQRLSESDGFFTTVDGSLASSNIRIGALNSYDTSSIWSSRDLNESKLISGHNDIIESSDVYFMDIDGTTTTDGTVIGGEFVDEIGDNTLSTWSLGEDFTSHNLKAIISGGFGGHNLTEGYKSWHILMRANGESGSMGANFGYMGQNIYSSFREASSASTGASSRLKFGDGLGLYSGFFDLKNIEKVALVNGDAPAQQGEYDFSDSIIKRNSMYAIYDLANTGDKSMSQILGDIDYDERYSRGNWSTLSTSGYRGWYWNYWTRYYATVYGAQYSSSGKTSTYPVSKGGRSGDLLESDGFNSHMVYQSAPSKFSVWAKFDPNLPRTFENRYNLGTRYDYKDGMSWGTMVFHSENLDNGNYYYKWNSSRQDNSLPWFMWYNRVYNDNRNYSLSANHGGNSQNRYAGPSSYLWTGSKRGSSSYGAGISFQEHPERNSQIDFTIDSSDLTTKTWVMRRSTNVDNITNTNYEYIRFYNPNSYGVEVTLTFNGYDRGMYKWKTEGYGDYLPFDNSIADNEYNFSETYHIPGQHFARLEYTPKTGENLNDMLVTIQFGDPEFGGTYRSAGVTEKLNQPEYLMGYGAGAYIPLVETDDEFMLYENREPELSGILSEYTIPHTGSIDISPTISDYEDSYVEMDFDYEILSGDLGDASVVIDDSGNISISRGVDNIECTLRFTLTDSRGASVYTDTTLTYNNLPPVVDSHNIESSYELVDGQDLFIAYPSAVDPEGDDVTWSYQIGQYDESRMTGEHKRSVTVSADDTGVTITPNGTWAAFGLTLTASDDVGRTIDIATQISYNIGIAPPVWLSPAAGDLLNGEEYELGDSIDHTFNTLSITGDPINYTLVDGWSLPDGITILADGSFDGVISGTSSGNYAFTVRATVDDGENYPYTDREFFVNVRGVLFEFSSHTFTSLRSSNSAEGWQADGKDLMKYKNAYNTNFDNNEEFFSVANGVQFWKVPKTGTYQITCVGAQGGNAYTGHYGGKGAYIAGRKNLLEGQILRIVVGGHGGAFTHTAGGGGASAVSLMTPETSMPSGGFWYNSSTPIVVAGGGGGAGGSGGNGKDASVTKYSVAGHPNYVDNTSNQLAGYGYRGSQNNGWGTGGAGWYYGGTGKNNSYGSYNVGHDAQALSHHAPYGASPSSGTSSIFITTSIGSCNGAAGGFGGGGAGACNGGGGGGGWAGGGPGGGGGSSYTDGLTSHISTGHAPRTTGFHQQLSHGSVSILFVSS